MNKHKYFILICLTWAYLFWGLIVLSGISAKSIYGIILIIMGGLSPFIATLMLLFRYEDKHTRSDFVKNIFNIRSIKKRYFYFIIFIPLLILHLSILTTYFLSQIFPFINVKEIVIVHEVISSSFLSILTFALIVLIAGPIPEEIGWRGYLLPNLLKKFTLLKSSIIIATVWGIWHLPLFLIKDYPLSDKLSNLFELIVYFAQLYPKAIIYSILFIKTKRSILMAIMFHFFINFYGMIFEINTITQYFELTLWSILAYYAYAEIKKNSKYLV